MGYKVVLMGDGGIGLGWFLFMVGMGERWTMAASVQVVRFRPNSGLGWRWVDGGTRRFAAIVGQIWGYLGQTWAVRGAHRVLIGGAGDLMGGKWAADRRGLGTDGRPDHITEGG